jgi:hypothetical protein
MLWVSIALYSGANEDEFRDFFHWSARHADLAVWLSFIAAHSAGCAAIA